MKMDLKHTSLTWLQFWIPRVCVFGSQDWSSSFLFFTLGLDRQAETGPIANESMNLQYFVEPNLKYTLKIVFSLFPHLHLCLHFQFLAETSSDNDASTSVLHAEAGSDGWIWVLCLNPWLLTPDECGFITFKDSLLIFLPSFSCQCNSPVRWVCVIGSSLHLTTAGIGLSQSYLMSRTPCTQVTADQAFGSGGPQFSLLSTGQGGGHYISKLKCVSFFV